MPKYMPKLISHTAPSGKEYGYFFWGLSKEVSFYITSYTQEWCTGITEKKHFLPSHSYSWLPEQLPDSTNECNIWVNVLFHPHVKNYSGRSKKQNWCG